MNRNCGSVLLLDCVVEEKSECNYTGDNDSVSLDWSFIPMTFNPILRSMYTLVFFVFILIVPENNRP